MHLGTGSKLRSPARWCTMSTVAHSPELVSQHGSRPATVEDATQTGPGAAMVTVRVTNHRVHIDDRGDRLVTYIDEDTWAVVRSQLFATLDAADGAVVRFCGRGIDVGDDTVDQARGESFCVIAELDWGTELALRRVVDTFVAATPVACAWWLVAARHPMVLHGDFPTTRAERPDGGA